MDNYFQLIDQIYILLYCRNILQQKIMIAIVGQSFRLFLQQTLQLVLLMTGTREFWAQGGEILSKFELKS